ncbi:MAG TPA: 2OG-Fe(II) oxygenase [Kofleriaceae bacterium]|nr:2OG-Fe(II) oxygenase [Kofleriaceae bacterium]
MPLIGEISGVYSREECEAWIARDREWLRATVNRASGREVDERVRNNSTAIVRDAAAAGELWQRITPHVPATMKSLRADGVFLPLRIYRYEEGERFGLHHDQSYLRDDGARSLLTLLVYLNDVEAGGETEFPEQGRVIVPRAGAALWFQHMLLHAGRPVVRGVKYVLRTDVVYAQQAGAPAR